MSVGIVMLIHEPLERAAEVARFWAGRGCPVVIHVDRRVRDRDFHGFRDALSAFDHVLFSPRWTCEWGTWSLVAASQTAAELLLAEFPDIRHVYLASGACLPLRPVDELRAFLDANPDTDFIESVTTRDVAWTIGGLDEERFTLSFPFAWRRRRKLFDLWVRIQRRSGLRRQIPEGLVPHLGSQWWCLTRRTLTGIFRDPRRREFERYFSRTWIPDESYFQTLARQHAREIESRSLTLSKFDHQGKPHVFYDDHIQLLRQSDCFVARKIWPRADRLYDVFLGPGFDRANDAPPAPARIDRVFSRALDRRLRGRRGLNMQSRFPRHHWGTGKTAAPYFVLSGFGDLFERFPEWLGDNADCLAHGHLFAPERAEFAGGGSVFVGNLPDSAALRDHNPGAFLSNLIWNTRGERQAFLFGPRDGQAISDFLADDPNARIAIVSGAWSVGVFRAGRDFSGLRSEAARLQRIEAAFLDKLRSPATRAQVQIWTMAEFLEDPIERLAGLIEDIGAREPLSSMIETPRLRRLDGFGNFLQALKNQGMQPHLMGEFPKEPVVGHPPERGGKPYLVR